MRRALIVAATARSALDSKTAKDVIRRWLRDLADADQDAWCEGYVEGLRDARDLARLDWDDLSLAYALGYPDGERTGEEWNALERWPQTAVASDTIKGNVS
jgi:hypothetical protein